MIAARAISVGRSGPPRGLAWCDWGVTIDRATLAPGQRVITDYVVLERNAPLDADIVEMRERIAAGPGDDALVFAWNGQVVGCVQVGKRGGVLLDFAWPEGLPAKDPAASAGA